MYLPEAAMTLHAPDDPHFSPDLTEPELEQLLDVIRETAEMATGAAASAVLVNADLAGGLKPGVSIVPEGPLGRALRDFANQESGGTVDADTPRTRLGTQYRVRQLQLHGTGYKLLGLPLAGRDSVSGGVLCFAFRAEDWQGDQTIAPCRRLAHVAELLWSGHENVADLTYEVVSLTNRTARLQRIAEIDVLTQLENPASFENKASALLDSGLQGAAFVVIDIDHFKLVNDLYGHQFGDTYLKTIAKALRTNLPDVSVVGRLGGDEFGVLTPLPPGGRAYLDGLLSRCRSGIQRATALLGKPDLGHVSIGASQYPDHGKTYSQLFEMADAALYAAKDSGRSISTVFHPRRHDRYNNSELGKQFLSAVRRDDILPHFQPVVDLSDGTCTGFEVLARWRDSRGRNLPPSEFSAIFRDHSMAEKMTRTIMHRAFRDYAAAIAPTGVPMRLALNVTFFDLMNPEFAFEVQSAVADTGFDWNLLTIEVTEQTMLGEQSGQIFRSLHELRARGASVALDDFGTGYGGLRHLAHWPIDLIKIDKYFVDNLTTGNRDLAVLDSIVSMCRNLGHAVIAEGVETAQQVTVLRNIGCHYGQGYLFDQPLSGDSLASYRTRYDLG